MDPSIIGLFVAKHWRALLVGVLVGLLGTQSARLGDAKHDLQSARDALKDPVTGKTWQSEADGRLAALGTCNAQVKALNNTAAAQSEAAAAFKATMEDRIAAAQKAAQQALGARRKADQAVADLLSRKDTGDACKDMLEALK